jgi:integrase
MDINILTISERLGHEKEDTTWNTYSHLYPNKQIELLEKLEVLNF